MGPRDTLLLVLITHNFRAHVCIREQFDRECLFEIVPRLLMLDAEKYWKKYQFTAASAKATLFREMVVVVVPSDNESCEGDDVW